jgi:hypothetical protein
MSVRK